MSVYADSCVWLLPACLYVLLCAVLLCCVTVFVSYAVVSLSDAVLYTNPAKVTPPVAALLKEGGVVVRPYAQLVPDIKATAAQGTKVAMDLARVSAWRRGGRGEDTGGGESPRRADSGQQPGMLLEGRESQEACRGRFRGGTGGGRPGDSFGSRHGTTEMQEGQGRG